MTQIEHRDFQIKVHDGTIDAFNEGHKSVMIESPTGSGKTIMALSILKDMGCKRMGWVTRRPSLLTQVHAENNKFFGLDFDTFTMFADNPTPDLDILVIDEAHCDATASMNHIYEVCKPKLVLGLSATPIRHDKAILPYGKTIKEAGYTQLILKGYLANFNHFVLDDYTVGNVTSTYLRFKEMLGKTVMFFLTRAEAYEAHLLLKNMGVNAECVTGDDSQSDRKIDAFRNGEIDVLTNIFLLTEGFDCPDLNTVFIRDTYSSTAHLQMCGRVLRPFEGRVKNILESKNSRKSIIKRFQGVPQIPYNRFKQNGNDFEQLGMAESYNHLLNKFVEDKISNIVEISDSKGMMYAKFGKKRSITAKMIMDGEVNERKMV